MSKVFVGKHGTTVISEDDHKTTIVHSTLHGKHVEVIHIPVNDIPDDHPLTELI